MTFAWEKSGAQIFKRFRCFNVARNFNECYCFSQKPKNSFKITDKTMINVIDSDRFYPPPFFINRGINRNLKEKRSKTLWLTFNLNQKMLQIHTKPLTNSKENQARDNNKRKSQVFPFNFDLKREVKEEGERRKED